MAERKRFVSVQIPILEKEIQVLGTPKDLTNKTIKMDLSKKLRGKGLTITLQILNNEDNLIAYPKKFELTKSYLRRIIRKRTDNVEDSFQTNAKDLKITLKPFLITRKKVSRAVRKNLRNTAREFLLNYVKEKTYLEISQEILEGTLQKEMLPKLKKVYPLAFCDLRVFETSEVTKITPEMPAKEEKVEETKEEPSAEEEKAEESVEEEEAFAPKEGVPSEEGKEKPKAKKKAAKKVTKKKTAKKEEKENADKE